MSVDRPKPRFRLTPRAAIIVAAIVSLGGIAAAQALPGLQLAGRPTTSTAPCKAAPAELARATGVSPAELQVLQSLGERRRQLDQREADLTAQGALIQATEAKFDARAKALDDMKAQVEALMNQATAAGGADVERMAAVYGGMKPNDAAARLVLLDDSIRLPIVARMKPRVLSAILAQMSPSDAKTLTEKLEARFAALRDLSGQGAKAG